MSDDTPPSQPPQPTQDDTTMSSAVQSLQNKMQVPSRKCAIEQDSMNALLPYIEKAQKRGAFTLRDAYLIVGNIEQMNATPLNSEQRYRASSNTIRIILNATFRAHAEKAYNTDEILQIVNILRNMDKQFKTLDDTPEQDDAIISDDITSLRKASNIIDTIVKKCCQDLEFTTILNAFESIDYLNETANTMSS